MIRRFLRELALLAPIWLVGAGCGACVGAHAVERLHPVATMQQGTRVIADLWEKTL